MNLINFISKGPLHLNIEQRLLQKLLYFNISKYIQELMFLGFEYSFQTPTVLDIESTKSYFYTAPFFRLNELLKYNYLIKEFSSLKNTKKKGFNSYLYFLNYINSFKSTNPFSSTLHLMSNTGAKATWNQVCQLIGARGYLANAEGNSFKLPILNSFNVGLVFYEYFISCYGARKGILDTAIKTADAGYLTRRLVESAQEVTIKEYNCGTKNYIQYDTRLNSKGETTLPLFLFLYGKLLTHNILDFNTRKIIELKNKYITTKLIDQLKSIGLKKNIIINTSSIKTCTLGRSFCSRCFGFSTFKHNYLGKSVGVLAGQSVGEPGTQMTLRTFHTGGTISINNTKIYKYPTNFFNKINKLILKKKKFKICSCIKGNYTFNYKYVSFVLHFNKVKRKILFLLNKHNSIYLLLIGSKLIYYINNISLLNTILFNFYVYNIYQRQINNKYSIDFNYTGEVLLKKSINLILKNTSNKWMLFNLNKTLLYKNFFYMFILNMYDTLKYKVSKNNRVLKVYILRKNLTSLFYYRLLKNYLHSSYLLYIYNIYFNLNKYQIIENKYNNIHKHKIHLFYNKILILKNNYYIK